MTTTKSTPLTDAALAELDRLHEAAIKGMNWQEVAQFQAMITEQYQPMRQRLTDAESRLADAERERDELRAEVRRNFRWSISNYQQDDNDD